MLLTFILVFCHDKNACIYKGQIMKGKQLRSRMGWYRQTGGVCSDTGSFFGGKQRAEHEYEAVELLLVTESSIQSSPDARGCHLVWILFWCLALIPPSVQILCTPLEACNTMTAHSWKSHWRLWCSLLGWSCSMYSVFTVLHVFIFVSTWFHLEYLRIAYLFIFLFVTTVFPL